jgi:hypothetical protein
LDAIAHTTDDDREHRAGAVPLDAGRMMARLPTDLAATFGQLGLGDGIADAIQHTSANHTFDEEVTDEQSETNELAHDLHPSE